MPCLHPSAYTDHLNITETRFKSLRAVTEDSVEGGPLVISFQMLICPSNRDKEKKITILDEKLIRCLSDFR